LHPQPSRRQRGALLIELRVRMVGSAGNAPVRRFRLCFVTPDLQSGSRIASLGRPTQVVGSGSGSHTHLKKFMRLLSVHWSSFPQLNWWSRWVTLPHQLACRASALLVCHDPGWIYDLRFRICDLAGRLGAAPSRLSFGNSAARLVRGLFRNRQSQIINRKWNGAAAGSRTRTICLAGRHSPVKPQPRN
jgi:hypothetical protein